MKNTKVLLLVASSSLTSMMDFVRNNPNHPKLDQVIQNLKEKSMQHLSVEGLKTVLDVQYDSVSVNAFIKDYLSDPTLGGRLPVIKHSALFHIGRAICRIIPYQIGDLRQ